MLARKAANITSIRRIAAAQATARRQLTKQQQAAASQQVRLSVHSNSIISQALLDQHPQLCMQPHQHHCCLVTLSAACSASCPCLAHPDHSAAFTQKTAWFGMRTWRGSTMPSLSWPFHSCYLQAEKLHVAVAERSSNQWTLQMTDCTGRIVCMKMWTSLCVGAVD